MFQSPKPFGQQSTFSGFGGPSTSTPFGQNSFAKPATSGFSAPTFGSTTGSALFGQNPQPASGGLFGSTQGSAFGQQPAQSSFGFSSTQPSTLFSQPSQQTPAPAAGGLFGASTSSAFGQNKLSFGFGSTNTGTGLFGQTQTQQPQATSVFGQTNPSQNSNIFGAAPGGFGATAPQGTTIKFVPVSGSDTVLKNGTSQSISIRHNCITCMKEYESKSLEELRLEDYMANRKGPQAGAGVFGPSQPTLFGAPSTSTTTTGLFGGSTDNKTLFGQPSTSIGFGSSTSAFGSTQTNTLFGKPATGFGAATTSTTSAFGFNTPTAANPFGANTQPKPFGVAAPQTNSIFGAPVSQPSSGFGSAPSSGFGSFGSQPNQSIGLFNQNKTPFSLGTTNSAFSFGQNTSTTAGSSSLFGAKTSAPVFGNQTGFGAPATGATAFSNTFGAPSTTQSTSLFTGAGFNKPSTGFSFGPTPSSTSGLGLNMGQSSLFGNTAQKPSLFSGASTSFGSTGLGTNTGFGTGTGLGTGLNLGGNSMLGTTNVGLGGAPASQASQLAQQQLLAMASVPFGDSPLFRNLLPSTGRSSEVLQPTNPAAQKAVLNSSAQYKVSPRNAPKIKVKVGYPPLAKKSIFEGLEEDDGGMSQTFQIRPNPKRLSITPVSMNRSSSEATTSHLAEPQESEKENTSPQLLNSSAILESGPTDWLQKTMDRSKSGSSNNVRRTLNDSRSSHEESAFENTVFDLRPQLMQPSPRAEEGEQSAPCGSSNQSPGARSDDKTDANSNNSSSSSDDSQELEDSVPQLLDAESHPTGIICRRIGYYTIPSLDELTGLMSDDGSCIVDNFTIGRENYGNVFFEGQFDVADLNLDEIVHFRHKEVVIYPDDSHKPPVGQGLNRRAQVTLDRVWPMDKTTHNPITDPDRLAQMDYEAKLRRVCAKMGARFKDYRPQTGSWVFTVDHFSKYGMTDSDEEDGAASATASVASKVVGVPPVEVKKLKLRQSQDKMHLGIDSFKTSPQYSKEIPKGLGGLVMDTMFNKANPFGTFEDDHDMDERPSYDDDMLGKKVSQMVSPMTLLARETGTSSHKVQLMKSSFFMGGDEEDDVSPFMEGCALPYDGICRVGDGTEYSDGSEEEVARMAPILSKHGLLRTQFTGSEQSSLSNRMVVSTVVSSTDTLPNLLNARKPHPICNPVVDKRRTVVLKHHGTVSMPPEMLSGRFLADMTLMRGAAFRVGWALDSSLLYLSSVTTSKHILAEASKSPKLPGGLCALSTLLAGRDQNDTSGRLLSRINLCGGDQGSQSDFRNSIEGHLQIQLEHSVAGVQGGCPIRAPVSCTDALHKHNSEALRLESVEPNKLLTYHSQVWELCVALWGNVPDLELSETESSSHHAVMIRREAVSQWLESVARPIVEEETSHVFGNSSSHAFLNDEQHVKGILSLLSGRQLLEACQKAQDYGDHYCALLLSQLSGSSAVRKIMQEQLTSWQESGADMFINPLRLQLMLLVAGLPVLELSDKKAEIFINTCHQLDWKRAFATHLWYMCSPIASISDALHLYQEAFCSSDEGHAYAKRPDPPYLDEFSDDCIVTAHGRKVNDLCYHLLQLYCERSHALEQLLNPATHTSDPLDYRLSWCLMQVLESLDYNHLSPLSASIIHTSFASQLESQGLWHWSIFVLLHLKDDVSRKSSVLDVLGRHVELLDSRKFSEQEVFLHDKLNIPQDWIYRAKAIRAKAMHRHVDQAWYLIWASEWNDAHEVIMAHISADAIINERYSYLESLLRELKPAERSSMISGWMNQGALLWDYLAVVKAVEDLLAGVTSSDEHETSYKLEKIQPQLNSLCSRINNLPCQNAKDRLCQCEIAKRASTLVRNVTQLQQGESAVWSRTLSHLVAQLPLPEDYAQQELQQLTMAYTV